MHEIKIVLFDVDGVLIKPPYYFSEALEKEGYRGAKKNLDDYFHSLDNNLCLERKAGAEAMIERYLKKFGWRGTSREYFAKQFDFEKSYIDGKMISYIKGFQKQGIKCCLCTDQFASRAKFILDEMNFRNIFDRSYISCEIGFRKCSEEFWKFLIEDLKKEYSGLGADQIAFFDDIQTNIDAAMKFRIKAFLFSDLNQFEKDMSILGLG